ncbi:HicB-like antitoxin of toxin-antitoxin system domain-containing protein [Candidatus Electronema halotolerans]|jgi:predicted RNase H-like HicB family nuclease
MQFNAIIEHDQDGWYAYVPSLQGCVSQGDTLEEVLANIKEAVELYLEDMDEQEKESLSKCSYLIAPIQIAAHV